MCVCVCVSSPFDHSDRIRPLSVSRQSVSGRKSSVYSWTAPSSPSFVVRKRRRPVSWVLVSRGTKLLLLSAVDGAGRFSPVSGVQSPSEPRRHVSARVPVGPDARARRPQVSSLTPSGRFRCVAGLKTSLLCFLSQRELQVQSGQQPGRKPDSAEPGGGDAGEDGGRGATGESDSAEVRTV